MRTFGLSFFMFFFFLIQLAAQENSDAVYKKWDRDIQIYVNKEGYSVTRSLVNYEIEIVKKSASHLGNFKFEYYYDPMKGFEGPKEVEGWVTSKAGKLIRLDESQITRQKISKYFYVMSIAMPSVEEGCTVSLSLKLFNPFRFSQDYSMQKTYPIRSAKLNVDNQSTLALKTLLHGVKSDWTTISSKEAQVFQKGDTKIEMRAASFEVWNMPEFVEEPMMPSANDYSVYMTLESNETFFNRYKDWQDLAEYFMLSHSYGLQYHDREHNKKLVNMAMPEMPKTGSDSMKIEAAAQWLLSHFESDEDYDLLIGKARIDDYLTSKEVPPLVLNMMLLAICEEMKIEKVWLALISTRENGRVNENDLYLGQFNHGLVYFEGGAKPKFFDVTNKYQYPGIPTARCFNNRAWVVDRFKAKWVDVSPPKSGDAFQINATLDPSSGVLTGKCQTSHTELAAYGERAGYFDNGSAEQWKERFKEAEAPIEISEVTCENLLHPELPFKEQFSIKTVIPQSGGQFLISPILFSAYKESKFTASTRNYPIQLGFPYKETFMFTMKIPDGYHLVTTPENMKLAYVNYADFNYNYTFRLNDEHTIQLTSILSYSRLDYGPEEYAMFRDFLNQIADKMSEVIIIAKD